jgi:hypothetical protein
VSTALATSLAFALQQYCCLLTLLTNALRALRWNPEDNDWACIGVMLNEARGTELGTASTGSIVTSLGLAPHVTKQTPLAAQNKKQSLFSSAALRRNSSFDLCS